MYLQEYISLCNSTVSNLNFKLSTFDKLDIDWHDLLNLRRPNNLQNSSEKTLETALKIKFSCGSNGYQTLPSLRNLRHKI